MFLSPQEFARMLLPNGEAVLHTLREFAILRGDELDVIRREVPDTSLDDSQEFVKWLIRQGFLTLYQGRKVVQGRASELIVGPYVIIEKIGEGGMGRVYRAHQPRMARSVALKIVRSELLTNIVALRRFQREARAAAQLMHPNIVRLLDADEIGDVHYLAMEYVDGSDLAKWVKTQGVMTPMQTCDVIRQAALGLQHAHEQSIIHRDIKPGNILLDNLGVVKVLDMGLARPQFNQHVEESETALTQDGTVVGTPDFMAPEQAKNSSTVDHRADLYSLGCTWFYLLTGQALFPTGTTLEKLLKHQMDTPPSLRQFRQDVPIAMEAILWKLLAKNPADRWPSAAMLAESLAPLIGISVTPGIPHWLIPEAAPLQPTMVVPSAPSMVQPPMAEAVDIELMEDAPETKVVAPPTAPTPPKARAVASPFDFDAPASGVPFALTAEVPGSLERRSTTPPKASPRRVPTWQIVVAGAAVFLLGLGVILGILHRNQPEPVKPEIVVQAKTKTVVPPVVPPTTTGMLDPLDIEPYLPSDTVGLITIRASRILQTELVTLHLATEWEGVRQAISSVIPFDTRASVDRVTVAFDVEISPRAVVFVQGTLAADLPAWLRAQIPNDPRFQEESIGEGERRITLFRLPDTDNRAHFYLTILGPTLLAFSPTRERTIEMAQREVPTMRTPRRDLVCYPVLTKLEPLATVWGCYMDHTTKRSVEDRIHGWTLKGTLGSRCTIEWDVEGRNVSDVSNYAIVRQAGLITLAAMSTQWKPLQPLLQSVSTDTLSQRQPARVRFRYDTDIADIANFIKLVMKPSE